MFVAVADTHTVVWYLANDPHLSAEANRVLDSAVSAGNEIAISAISLVELVYLVEKGRVPAQRFTELANALRDPSSVFVEVSVDLRIARALSGINAAQIPDMPDRIIAATALHLNVPVISRDGKIASSDIQTIW